MISASDLEPYYPDAAKVLDCEPAEFYAAEHSMPRESAISWNRLERWSNQPQLVQHLTDLGSGLPITIVVNATVVDIEFNDQGNCVTGLVVASDTGRRTFRGARNFVIVCGGLETARLLLNVQAKSPSLFGGRGGALGRYYMGHLSGKIARIEFSRPSQARIFNYRRDEASISRRRITIVSAAQIGERVPNAEFYLDHPSIADPDHRVGALSAAFLALSVPILGRRFVSEPIRLMNLAKKPRYLAHLRNILLDIPRTTAILLSLARQRFLGARVKSALFLFDVRGIYPLHYHAEQLPHRDSCVELADTRDRYGMRQLKIRLQFSMQDAEGVVRAHDVVDGGLKSANVGALVFEHDRAERPAAVLGQAKDGFHQIGLTRMGRDAEDGVVDQDCRVFGISNLFVAGTSVFRTSGAANPTFSAVALALRLAAHIAGGRGVPSAQRTPAV